MNQDSFVLVDKSGFPACGGWMCPDNARPSVHSISPMSPTPSTDPSFEQAMERLEEIVAQMEGDRMPLDEMVASYEEGMRLLKVCRKRIETARRRIEVITSDAEGKVVTEPFDPANSESPPPEEKPRLSSTPRRKKTVETEEDPDDIRLF